jgi:hypothetical protein
LLDYEQVRSSIARRLGINTAGLVPGSCHIEGEAEMPTCGLDQKFISLEDFL